MNVDRSEARGLFREGRGEDEGYSKRIVVVIECIGVGFNVGSRGESGSGSGGRIRKLRDERSRRLRGIQPSERVVHVC